jgi:uncharacterized protein YjbJ (UPF0337 family)
MIAVLGLRQPRRETAAVSQDRDNLVSQRGTASAPDLAAPPGRVTRLASTGGRRHPGKEGVTMSAADKVKNTAETAKGNVKEGAGQATGNESLATEGRADQAKGRLRQAGEKIRDAFRK